MRIVQLDDLVTGTVTRSADFGVTFIDFGGFEAMINMPESALARVGRPSEAFSVDQRVDARVVSIWSDRGRVSLSLRDVTEPDASATSPPSE